MTWKRMNWGAMANVPENEAKSEDWVSGTSVLTTLNHWYSSCTGFVM